jgi:hypothetical protein
VYVFLFLIIAYPDFWNACRLCLPAPNKAWLPGAGRAIRMRVSARLRLMGQDGYGEGRCSPCSGKAIAQRRQQYSLRPAQNLTSVMIVCMAIVSVVCVVVVVASRKVADV